MQARPIKARGMATDLAALTLAKQLKGERGALHNALPGPAPAHRPPRPAELTKNPVDGFSAGLVNDDNVFEWQLTIIGPPDTL